MSNSSQPKPQSLRSQSVWLLTAKVIGFALSFFLPLVIVRSIPQDGVGLYRESFQIVTNAVVLLPLGFSMSAYYFLARETERRGQTVLNILIFNTVAGGLAFVLLCVFPGSIGQVFQSDELSRLAPMIGLVIWIWIIGAFLETIAIANGEARTATVFIVFASLTKTLLLGAAVLTLATVESFLYAAIIQGALQITLLAWYLRSRFPRFWRGFELSFFWQQARYAVPFGLTGILYLAQYDIHNYFVGYKFSTAEYAIYAYGCFQVPLIALLSESVSTVLMTKMNDLQRSGEIEEMLRITIRGIQKLAFVFFPTYVFLLITSHTFITTLFTESYEASAAIFAINLTILPFGVMITDPVVRSFKELGRPFLFIRLLVFTAMVAVLYLGLSSLSLVGVATVAVGAILVEKLLTETLAFYKLGFTRRHLPLLANTAKTAVAAVIAGILTFVVYTSFRASIAAAGADAARQTISAGETVASFIGGSLVLLVCALVYAPVYLFAANVWGVIEDDEKLAVRNFFGRFSSRRPVTPVV